MQSNEPFFHGRNEEKPSFDVDTVGLRIAGVITVALFVSSHLPLPLVPLVFSNLLLMSGVVTMAVAMLTGASMFANRLTRWDEAAIFSLCGYIALLCVDGAAAQEAIAVLQGQIQVGEGGSQGSGGG